jgi:uncharacterized protein
MSTSLAEASSTTSAASPSIETGVDVLIVLLYAPGISRKVGEPIKGITRLQKLLFLLWKEGHFYEWVKNLYNFQAYDFGPCMDDLYDDLEFVEELGLVKVNEVPSGNEYEGGDEEAFVGAFGFRFLKRDTRRDFSLTPAGIGAAKELYDGLTKTDRESLNLIKSKYNQMGFWDLLRYVYKKYPAFAEKSVLSLSL